MEREPLTDEELMRVFSAIRAPRKRAVATLEAASPEGTLPRRWNQHSLDLSIRIERAGSGVNVQLSGGAAWQGALVHCRWDWLDSTQPERQEPESLTAFIRLPSEDFQGRYLYEADIPERVTFCPAIARIVPRYADPEMFKQQWLNARVKPGLEVLREWVEANRDNFAPRHRERWQRIPDELQQC